MKESNLFLNVVIECSYSICCYLAVSEFAKRRSDLVYVTFFFFLNVKSASVKPVHIISAITMNEGS